MGELSRPPRQLAPVFNLKRCFILDKKYTRVTKLLRDPLPEFRSMAMPDCVADEQMTDGFLLAPYQLRINHRGIVSAPQSRRRCGARHRAILSWCRRNRFSYSTWRHERNGLAKNITSKWQYASITSNDALILFHCANPPGLDFREGQAGNRSHCASPASKSRTWRMPRF
jgi:hypothetical protein